MKFKVDVDIEDWNPEEEKLKDFIENRITDHVSEKVTKKIFTDVYINACEKIGVKVDDYINKTLTEFIDRRIVVTDKWGDKIEEHENVYEMLKERFDNFMTAPVDSKGKTIKKGCSYNGNDMRIKQIVSDTADRHITKFTKDISKITEGKIKSMLKESLKKELSDTMFENIDVKKLLRGF